MISVNQTLKAIFIFIDWEDLDMVELLRLSKFYLLWSKKLKF